MSYKSNKTKTVKNSSLSLAICVSVFFFIFLIIAGGIFLVFTYFKEEKKDESRDKTSNENSSKSETADSSSITSSVKDQQEQDEDLKQEEELSEISSVKDQQEQDEDLKQEEFLSLDKNCNIPEEKDRESFSNDNKEKHVCFLLKDGETVGEGEEKEIKFSILSPSTSTSSKTQNDSRKKSGGFPKSIIKPSSFIKQVKKAGSFLGSPFKKEEEEEQKKKSPSNSQEGKKDGRREGLLEFFEKNLYPLSNSTPKKWQGEGELLTEELTEQEPIITNVGDDSRNTLEDSGFSGSFNLSSSPTKLSNVSKKKSSSSSVPLRKFDYQKYQEETEKYAKKIDKLCGSSDEEIIPPKYGNIFSTEHYRATSVSELMRLIENDHKRYQHFFNYRIRTNIRNLIKNLCQISFGSRLYYFCPNTIKEIEEKIFAYAYWGSDLDNTIWGKNVWIWKGSRLNRKNFSELLKEINEIVTFNMKVIEEDYQSSLVECQSLEAEKIIRNYENNCWSRKIDSRIYVFSGEKASFLCNDKKKNNEKNETVNYIVGKKFYSTGKRNEAESYYSSIAKILEEIGGDIEGNKRFLIDSWEKLGLVLPGQADIRELDFFTKDLTWKLGKHREEMNSWIDSYYYERTKEECKNYASGQPSTYSLYGELLTTDL